MAYPTRPEVFAWLLLSPLKGREENGWACLVKWDKIALISYLSRVLVEIGQKRYFGQLRIELGS
jgi:hypothetical protein